MKIIKNNKTITPIAGMSINLCSYSFLYLLVLAQNCFITVDASDTVVALETVDAVDAVDAVVDTFDSVETVDSIVTIVAVEVIVNLSNYLVVSPPISVKTWSFGSHNSILFPSSSMMWTNLPQSYSTISSTIVTPFWLS